MEIRLNDKIEKVPIGKLRAYERNARTHSPEQVNELCESIKAFGFTNPLLIDGANEVIAGHGRLMAAKMLGMRVVPCIRLNYLTDAQKRALVIADNKLALNAGWDTALLALELAELRDEGFEVKVIGFSEDELAKLWIPAQIEGQTDPDDVPEIEETPVSAPGDVWILGSHRIICGDSTDPATVEKVLDGAAPHLMVTDPPYGVEYDAKWRNDPLWKNPHGKRAVGKVDNDNRVDWGAAWALFGGEVAYVWHAATKSHQVAESLLQRGFDLRSQIIWAKPHYAIGRGHYHFQHEPCWYAVRGVGHWAGSRKESTLWQITNATFQGGQRKEEDAKTGHSTQKPVECMRKPIENNSRPGEAVYEPFSGSGSTIIAAEQTGRRAYAVELNPLYVDVAVRRWQMFTGLLAKHAETGRPFGEAADG